MRRVREESGACYNLRPRLLKRFARQSETRYKGASCALTSSKRAEAGRQTSEACPPSPPCGFSFSPKISCGHFWECPCKVKSLRGTFRLRTQSATLLRVLTVYGVARDGRNAFYCAILCHFSETEPTIPQSCFACQLPLHKGAIIKNVPPLERGGVTPTPMPPLMVRGGVERSETEGIRRKSAKMAEGENPFARVHGRREKRTY